MFTRPASKITNIPLVLPLCTSEMCVLLIPIYNFVLFVWYFYIYNSTDYGTKPFGILHHLKDICALYNCVQQDGTNQYWFLSFLFIVSSSLYYKLIEFLSTDQETLTCPSPTAELPIILVALVTYSGTISGINQSNINAKTEATLQLDILFSICFSVTAIHLDRLFLLSYGIIYLSWASIQGNVCTIVIPAVILQNLSHTVTAVHILCSLNSSLQYFFYVK